MINGTRIDNKKYSWINWIFGEHLSLTSDEDEDIKWINFIHEIFSIFIMHEATVPEKIDGKKNYKSTTLYWIKPEFIDNIIKLTKHENVLPIKDRSLISFIPHHWKVNERGYAEGNGLLKLNKQKIFSKSNKHSHNFKPSQQRIDLQNEINKPFIFYKDCITTSSFSSVSSWVEL